MVKHSSPSAWSRCLLSLLLFASYTTAVIKRQEQDPPQIPLVYKLSIDDFNKTLDKFIPAQTAVYAQGLKPSVEDATFENTIQAMTDLEAEAALILAPLHPYPSLGETRALRQAAIKAFARGSDIFRNSTADPNLFARVQKIYRQFEQDGKLETTDGILTKSWYNSLQASGGGLAGGPGRDKFLQITKNLSDNEDSFNENVNGINATIYFTQEELSGVKTRDLNNLEQGTGAEEGRFGLDLASASDVSKIQSFAER